MSGPVDRASAWVYEGMWGALSGALRVPRDPPTLPTAAGEEARSFRPSEGWLRMRKFWFWLFLLATDGMLAAIGIVVFFLNPVVGLILALPLLALIVLPDIVAFAAIHLAYDTTWYVLTGRALRIRRGVFTVSEMTITFDNVQNVSVRQGPVQRWFGVGDVVVETAGVAGSAAGGKGGPAAAANRGVLEGLADFREVRDLVASRMRGARGGGLGDDRPAAAPAGLGPEHAALLREIRDGLRACRSAAG